MLVDLEEKCLIKGKLSSKEQIDYMKFKGLTFDFINEEDALRLLTNNTYYYKLTSFRKNFKNKNGKYLNLDFGNLNDLATIDMYFRYVALKLTLDLEHSLKVLLINMITELDVEDGYTIVHEFDWYCKKIFLDERPWFREEKYKNTSKKILSRSREEDGYNHDLFDKRRINPAIWVIIELMSYGELIRFIEFYYTNKEYQKKKLDSAFRLLKYTRNFRNAAAHNRPVIWNITKTDQFSPNELVTNFASKANIEKATRKHHFSNMKIHDFTCILILHMRYVSNSEMKADRKMEMKKLVARCKKRQEYYQSCPELSTIFKSFRKLVDCYNQ